MARLEINKGADRLYVDDYLLPELEGKNWTGGRGTSVGRVYRHQGTLVRESLAEVITGEKLMGGYRWGHKDGDWKNFEGENLIMVPRHQALMEGTTPEERSARAKKASKAASGKGGRSRKHNDSGYLGVYTAGSRFKAMCVVEGVQRYLGLYETPQMAAYAYDEGLKAQGLEAIHKVELPEEVAEVIRAKVSKLLSK